MNYSPTRVVVVLALLLALGSFGVVEIVDPGKLLDWVIEFTATLVAAALAVVGGILLFHYESRETEAQLREKLRMRVALEWKRNLERLETGVTTPFVRQRTGEHLGEIVTAELSTVALRDLIRSEVFEPGEVLDAMRLEARINAYNGDVEVLLEQFAPAVSAQVLRYTIVEMNERKNLLIHDLGEQLRSLRDRGIEVPD